jgi:hypothetical protein
VSSTPSKWESASHWIASAIVTYADILRGTLDQIPVVIGERGSAIGSMNSCNGSKPTWPPCVGNWAGRWSRERWNNHHSGLC